MARSFRIDARSCRRLLAAGLALAVASCAEITTVADVVFPSTVPGLPSDQAWESLPIRRWLTDSPLDSVAISACFTCAEPAVVGLFQAQGEEAVSMRRAAADPATLVAALTRAKSPERQSRKPVPPPRIDAEPATEGGTPGFVVRLARRDGKRRAAGYVATVERDGATRILVIVAGSDAQARHLARSIIPRL